LSYHIKAISLNEQEEVKESFKNYKVDNDILDNLSKINIFVGENNSGKSRFLRNLQSIEKD
jgi:AAA15 family ATPase/GTPase